MKTEHFILLLLVFISFSVFIAIYVKKEFYNKEGMDDPFSFIIKLFEVIFKIITNIAQIFMSLIQAFIFIGDIFNLLRCPISIIINFPLCFFCYISDLFFYIIYLTIWCIVFTFVYLPLTILKLAMCFFFDLSDWYDATDAIGCKRILEMDEVMFSKRSFFNFIDNIYVILFDDHLLYRDRDIMAKCYCLKPIRVFFTPLDEFYDFFKTKEGKKDHSFELLLTIIVFSIIYIMNLKKK